MSTKPADACTDFQLEQAYAAAWEECNDSGAAADWDCTAAHGLTSKPR